MIVDAIKIESIRSNRKVYTVLPTLGRNGVFFCTRPVMTPGNMATIVPSNQSEAMPTYDYRCEANQQVYEVKHSSVGRTDHLG